MVAFIIVVMLLSLEIKILYHLLGLMRSVSMLPYLRHSYSFSLSSVQGSLGSGVWGLPNTSWFTCPYPSWL